MQAGETASNEIEQSQTSMPSSSAEFHQSRIPDTAGFSAHDDGNGLKALPKALARLQLSAQSTSGVKSDVCCRVDANAPTMRLAASRGQGWSQASSPTYPLRRHRFLRKPVTSSLDLKSRPCVRNSNPNTALLAIGPDYGQGSSKSQRVFSAPSTTIAQTTTAIIATTIQSTYLLPRSPLNSADLSLFNISGISTRGTTFHH